VNVRFLSLTEQEIDEAVAWFDEQIEGKGTEFLDELDRVIRRIKVYPFASTEIEPDRRYRRSTLSAHTSLLGGPGRL
jgi:hypothetical protein